MVHKWKQNHGHRHNGIKSCTNLLHVLQHLSLLHSLFFGHQTSLFQSKSQELPEIYTTKMKSEQTNEKLPQIETPAEK